MGEVEVPDDALWRAQTARAVENFPISGTRLEDDHVKALAQVKTLLDLGTQPSDLVMPGNEAAADLWLQLNRLATNVVALYAVPKS